MSTRTDDPTDDKAKDGPATFELANGIALELRPTSPYLLRLQATEAQAGRPTPPVHHVEAKGRDEANEDDPTYRAALAEWLSETGWRTLYVVASVCVTVTHVPDGIAPHESVDWAGEIAEVYGLTLEQNPKRRLAQWLFLHTNTQDLIDLGPMLMEQGGAQELEVQRVLDSFRSDGGRSADQGSNGVGGGQDDHPDTANPAGNRASRRRTRKRDA